MKPWLVHPFQEVRFGDPTYGIASFDPTVSFDASTNAVAPVTGDTPGASADNRAYIACHVMPLELAELEAALASPEYGISEKVNGHRTFVAYDGHTELTAYNRRRIKATSVPAAAHALRKLGRQFVVDGERLLGDQAGQYVIFDLLELDGSRLRIASATCSSDIPNFLAIAPLATPMEC